MFESSDFNKNIFLGKFIFMIIDAMRYDFVFETAEATNKNLIRMPFVNKLLRNRKAIPYKLIAKPPTVTLRRIKVNITLFQIHILFVVFKMLNETVFGERYCA